MRPPSLAELPAPPPGKAGWPWTEAPEPTPPPAEGWPRISVLTPSYEQGEYLEEALRSVLLQGYPDLDYLVLDGGSNDGSAAIIERYAPWLSFWRSAADDGQSAAINEGFARANGDVLCWLNSDDVFAPGALQHVGRRLAGQRRTMMVGASVLTATADELAGETDRRFPSWPEMAYEARSFPQPSVFWTADLWSAAGPLDEALYFAMDYDLWLRMRPAADAVLRSDEVLSHARCHPGQKGARAAAADSIRRFDSQRVGAALNAAIGRGERPVAWLVRVLARRFGNAWRYRKASLLRPSAFERLAWQAVFSRRS